MSDAEDTEAVPSTPEVTAELVPTEGVALPEDVLIDGAASEIGNPSTDQVKYPPNALSKHEAIEIPENSNKDGAGSKEDEKQGQESNKTKTKKLQPCPPPQSKCRVRSRDMRQCKKHFREMIGKHEIRNDELEQRETDLRQRLEMLDCSMPAVMVWNIWRTAQGAPVSHLREIVEKQFLEPTAGFAACPSTPSQHWDCRVREVEAERKQALHRTEEARQVFAVKGDALKFQKQQIEEARRLQDERKMQITKLEEEVKRLQDALKKAQGDENSCETGECGEIQCRQMWLQGVSSVSSIHSTDLECLTKLQDLAEAELCMKRQIADLERRECAYMRTLQQADEMWAKMEDDNTSNLGDMKEQLDAKISANQQLANRIVELEDEIEKLRTQLAKALATLDEFKSKTFADIGLGDVNISTEEKIAQTEDKKKDIMVSEESKPGNLKVVTETKLPESNVVANTGEIEQLQADEAKEYTPIEETDELQEQIPKTKEKDSITAAINKEIRDAQSYDNQVPAATVDTTEESVQAKPESEEAETQSMTKKPGLEKETATEDPIQVETATITEVIGGEEMSAPAEIVPTVSLKYSAKEQQGITSPTGISKAEAKHIDEPVADTDNSRQFEDKASLAHLPKAPTKDKNTGVSVAAKARKDSDNVKEAFRVVPEAAGVQISRIVADPAHEKVSEATIKTTSELPQNDDIASEKTPELIVEPVAKVPIRATPEPVAETLGVASPGSPIRMPSESVIEIIPITSPEVLKEPAPRPFSEVNPIVLPMPTVKDTPGPVLAQVTEPAIDTIPKPSPKPIVEVLEEPVVEPTPKVMEPVQIKLLENTLSVPIQTLLSWHNITACLHKQILTCPQCSSTSEEIRHMLEEIRMCLGEDAPDLAKIKCPEVKGGVQNSTSVPNKKGPCICKPKTCPLDGTPAATPAQADVQIQTVVDGQSQTPMPAKIPSKETRSSRNSKGSMKNKEEIKLMSIEEGTEPDPGMLRAKSIPEARDESTVTVGDIASQTETIRKIPSLSKDEEKPCVCPTGVCPKKKAKTPCGECTPGKVCTAPKKALGKEYKSTADAILAPAIKVLPSYERALSPKIINAKADDTNSESSAFACCMCGKALTPVASKKSTAIPIPTKSVFKSKVILASEGSDDDFLCCSCKAKDSQSLKPKYSSPGKSSGKSPEIASVSRRVKPTSGHMKTSCSREICCSCDKQEIHVLTKTLTTDLEVSKSKTKPETKDVCCLAKISRDKASKTEARRRKDKDSIRSTTSSVSHSGSGQVSSSSSTYKGSKTNDISESNVCCSNIEQVTDAMKKKGKGRKCACDGQKDKNNKEGCFCGEDSEPILPKQGKPIEPTVSCVCPPKLFDKP